MHLKVLNVYIFPKILQDCHNNSVYKSILVLMQQRRQFFTIRRPITEPLCTIAAPPHNSYPKTDGMDGRMSRQTDERWKQMKGFEGESRGSLQAFASLQRQSFFLLLPATICNTAETWGKRLQSASLDHPFPFSPSFQITLWHKIHLPSLSRCRTEAVMRGKWKKMWRTAHSSD